jgi:hypothetical protein
VLDAQDAFAVGAGVGVGADHGAGDQLLELAHVVGPVVEEQGLGAVGRQAGRARRPLEEEARERQHVLRAGAKRRDLDAPGGQAREQVGAEVAGLHLAVEIAVGRGDDPHVDSGGRRRADRADLAERQGAQELRLELERQLADLVEEEGSAFRGDEQAAGAAGGAGEGAGDVAEELALGGFAATAAQFTGTRLPFRPLRRWISAATSSFPDPVSPRIRTGERWRATSCTSRRTCCMALLGPKRKFDGESSSTRRCGRA